MNEFNLFLSNKSDILKHMIFFLIQDSDCMICFETHASSECPNRTQQHCPDCHVFIRHCSDHTSVCGKKTWAYNQYGNLYANRPSARFVIGINTPFRFFMDNWRKGGDGFEMYSPVTGAFFCYKSDNDLVMLSRKFVGIRIKVVVKVSGKFYEKLWLVTSKDKLISAVHADKEFHPHYARDQHTTLTLAVSADQDPVIDINAFPKNKAARHYIIPFDKLTGTFKIPDGLALKAIGSTSSDTFGDIDAQQAEAQLNTSEIGAQSVELMEYNESRNRMSNAATENSFGRNSYNSHCPVCFGAHHSKECEQGKLENCFECHVPIRKSDDHASLCTVKQYFRSEQVNKYVKIPSIRYILSFKFPIGILLNGSFQMVQSGLAVISEMSDSYFKFESDKKLIVMTTGYTRIRLPLIVEDETGTLKEKLVLITSTDRAIVAVNGARTIVENNYIGDYNHNTPLVVYMKNPSDLSVEVNSAGGNVRTFEIAYRKDTKKFQIPFQLDIKSTNVPSMAFDAPLPTKVRRK